MPDNDNNSLLDPKVKTLALRELSRYLTELHEAIESASGALERLKETTNVDEQLN
ncbi:hypothetical protein [Rhizobium sp.]|uniref:hypothetical protein n=1 Tax=Rhizobium sp. TaxID=391 RepID=UPI002898C1EA